jgi:small subunit ribosomal protein S17
MTMEARNLRKTKTGTVTSAKMAKTIVVSVERKVKHPLYSRVVKRYSKFYAHDETGLAKQGDIVRIAETRPLSKLKRWRLVGVLTPAK